jgi:hypothetical protein
MLNLMQLAALPNIASNADADDKVCEFICNHGEILAAERKVYGTLNSVQEVK